MTEPTTRSIPDPETSAQHIAQLRDFSSLLREVSADLSRNTLNVRINRLNVRNFSARNPYLEKTIAVLDVSAKINTIIVRFLQKGHKWHYCGHLIC